MLQSAHKRMHIRALPVLQRKSLEVMHLVGCIHFECVYSPATLSTYIHTIQRDTDVEVDEKHIYEPHYKWNLTQTHTHRSIHLLFT